MFVIFVFMAAAVIDVINANTTHWWHTSNDDIASLVLIVGAVVLLKIYQLNEKMSKRVQ